MTFDELLNEIAREYPQYKADVEITKAEAEKEYRNLTKGEQDEPEHN